MVDMRRIIETTPTLEAAEWKMRQLMRMHFGIALVGAIGWPLVVAVLAIAMLLELPA